MDKQIINRDVAFLGSGWSFPVTFHIGNHQVNVSAYEANINDSINIILQTRKGERTLEPDFGSGLQRFLFSAMDETLKGEIADAVRRSLLHNEPRITVHDVEVDYVDLQRGLVNIIVGYEYNQTNSRHNYVFPFYIKEGTNIG